jgi:hypothetical protein
VFAVGTGIASYARLLAKDALTNATGQHNGQAIQITPSLQPQAVRMADPIGQNSYINGPTGVVAGTKHHLAVTYDGTTQVVYIDGVAVGSGASTFNITDNAAPFTIGAGWDLTFGPFLYYTGLVAEVALYATALTAARVFAHFQAANL